MTEASTVDVEQEGRGFVLEEAVVGSDPGQVVNAAVVSSVSSPSIVKF